MAGDIHTKLVCCLTCCIEKSVQNPEMSFEEICWEHSYNFHLFDEELEAFEHSKENPRHIMVEGFDFGFKINGI